MLLPLVALSLAALPLPARVLPAPVRVEKLPNGLQVAVVAFPAEGVVALDVLIRAGSRDEGSVTGVAHLCEHLLFKGTANLPEAELQRRLQLLAADANGETDHDFLLVSDVAPAASLPGLLELEAERFAHARATPEAVATEAGTVRSEADARAADAEARLGWALEAAQFPSHPYGHRPIGTPQDLRNLHAATEAARAFFAKHFHPDAALVVISGDVEPDAAVAQVKRAFGGWKGRAASTAMREPGPASAAPVSLRVEGATPTVLVGFRGPPGAGGATGKVAAALLAGPLSALHRQLVLERDTADRVEADSIQRRDAALFTVTLVGGRAAELGDLERALDAELRALRTGNVDPAQLEEVRASILWGAVSSLDTPARVARAVAVAASATGDARELERTYADVAHVDAPQLAAFARALLTPERRTTATLAVPELQP